MKSLHFIFFCMITISVSFFSKSTGSSAASTFYSGRRTLIEVPIASPNHKNPFHKTQVTGRGRKKKKKKTFTSRSSYLQIMWSIMDNWVEWCEMQAIDDKTKQSTVKYAASTNDYDEIVYHIDYHGVTTHPTPTPRHPKP